MQVDKMVDLLSENFYTVACVFPESKDGCIITPPDNFQNFRGKQYTYKVPKHLDVQEGDYVVVQVGDVLKIVKVCERHEFPEIDTEASFRYRLVIGKVDLEAHATFVAQSTELEEKLKKLKRKAERAKLVAAFVEEYGEEGLAELGLVQQPAVPAIEGKPDDA